MKSSFLSMFYWH